MHPECLQRLLNGVNSHFDCGHYNTRWITNEQKPTQAGHFPTLLLLGGEYRTWLITSKLTNQIAWRVSFQNVISLWASRNWSGYTRFVAFAPRYCHLSLILRAPILMESGRRKARNWVQLVSLTACQSKEGVKNSRLVKLSWWARENPSTPTLQKGKQTRAAWKSGIKIHLLPRLSREVLSTKVLRRYRFDSRRSGNRLKHRSWGKED